MTTVELNIERNAQRKGMRLEPTQFPNVTTFEELFTAIIPKAEYAENPSVTEANSRHYSYSKALGGYSYGRVQCSELLERYIFSDMLQIDNDSISIEFVRHEHSGTFLVIAKYNLIIGSRWLADISIESVPEFMR